MFTRWTICFVLVAVLPVLLPGCASNEPSQAVIGTWETGIKDKKKTMTFWENGVWSFEQYGIKQVGTYKFVSDNEVEITIKDDPDDPKPTIYKRKISFAHHDKMVTTDVETTRWTTWRRVEQQ